MSERINLAGIEERMAAVRRSGYSDAAVVGLIHHDLPALVAWVVKAKNLCDRLVAWEPQDVDPETFRVFQEHAQTLLSHLEETKNANIRRGGLMNRLKTYILCRNGEKVEASIGTIYFVSPRGKLSFVLCADDSSGRLILNPEEVVSIHVPEYGKD